MSFYRSSTYYEKKNDIVEIGDDISDETTVSDI